MEKASTASSFCEISSAETGSPPSGASKPLPCLRRCKPAEASACHPPESRYAAYFIPYHRHTVAVTVLNGSGVRSGRTLYLCTIASFPYRIPPCFVKKLRIYADGIIIPFFPPYGNAPTGIFLRKNVHEELLFVTTKNATAYKVTGFLLSIKPAFFGSFAAAEDEGFEFGQFCP